MPNPTTSFTARRINLTTFVIIEDDKYGENPYIYAKVHPATPVLVLSDTGCDAPRNGAGEFLSLCVRACVRACVRDVRVVRV